MCFFLFMTQKILTFRVCKNDFEKFASGKEKTRFREASNHWKSRLLEKNGDTKHFDHIKIVNGYHRDSPTIIAEFAGITPGKNSENADGFFIHLGKILELSP